MQLIQDIGIHLQPNIFKLVKKVKKVVETRLDARGERGRGRDGLHDDVNADA